MQSLINDVQDSANYYYIGIGRSEDWDSSDTAPTPVNTIREQRKFRQSIQSIKSASDVSFVVPRHNWSSGTIYSSWSDNTAGYPVRPYYVITENNAVYVCLKTGRDAAGNAVASTVEPSGTLTRAFKTSDGYIWKFLYSISTAEANRYLSANYQPIRFIVSTDSASTANEIEQKGIQDAAVAGEIIRVDVIAGGTGYTAAPTISIVGDGDSAEAFARISGGTIVGIDMDSNGSGILRYGSGYNEANIVISGGGGSGASARPVFGPQNGLGADPRDDLKATAVMFNTKPAGTENGDFITNNDFRQVALIKNPKVPLTDSDFSAGTAIAMHSLKFSSVSVAFTPDRTIQGGTSSARAIVDDFDSDTLYYHQSEETGFASFTEGETVSEVDGSGSGVLDSAGVDGDTRAFEYGEINRYSGEILYIDNRAAIDRATDQTEDIKVIIQL